MLLLFLITRQLLMQKASVLTFTFKTSVILTFIMGSIYNLLLIFFYRLLQFIYLMG